MSCLLHISDEHIRNVQHTKLKLVEIPCSDSNSAVNNIADMTSLHAFIC